MKTILVLEHESVPKMFLRQMLKQYSVIEARTAEQALRLFADHGRQIDLLIASVILKKSSGIHVALLLRSELPGLPVVLTSECPLESWSEPDSADLDRLGPHAVTILQKPFQAEVLSKAILEAIGTTQAEMHRTA